MFFLVFFLVFLVVPNALFWGWRLHRSGWRWRFAAYSRSEDTLRVTWNSSGGANRDAQTGTVIREITVMAPLTLVYGTSRWRVEIPNASKLHELDRVN